MQTVEEIAFVIIATVVLLLLLWFIYELTGRNYKVLFNWTKNTLTVTIIICVVLCIIKIIISNKIDFKDDTFAMLYFCLFTGLIDFLVIAFASHTYKYRREFENDLNSDRIIMICTLSIILALAATILDIVIFIFPGILQ